MLPFKITDYYPENGASGVYLNDIIWVQFNDFVDANTVTDGTFVLTDSEYVPVDGSSVVQGYTGGVRDIVVKFYPTDGLRRYADYQVLVVGGPAGILSSGGQQLDHDFMYYFSTGELALSGLPGVAPTGVVDLMSASVAVPDRATHLSVVSTYPVDGATNQPRTLQHIAITFNDPLQTGTNWYEHFTIASTDALQ